MALFTDVYDHADRIAVAARDLDRVMAIINDTGSRDLGDAVKHARIIADATARFLEDAEVLQARLSQGKRD